MEGGTDFSYLNPFLFVFCKRMSVRGNRTHYHGTCDVSGFYIAYFMLKEILEDDYIYVGDGITKA